MRSIKTVRWTVLVPGCVPASAEARRANSPSAPKRNSHFCGCFFFYIMRDSKRAMRSIKTVRRTVLVPGCVPASAEARRANSPSAPKRNSHFCGCFFYIMRDSKRAMRSIKTVRRTVLVPGCVPTSAEARRANLSICAKKKQSLLWLFLFLYNERFVYFFLAD